MLRRSLRGGECVDDVDVAAEQDRVTLHAGRTAQRGHQVTHAQTRAGDEDDVGILGHEVQAEQVLDHCPVDLRRPFPVELIERLEDLEVRLLDEALHATIGARGGLRAGQLGEVVQVRPVLVRRRRGQALMVLQHEGQVQDPHLLEQGTRSDLGAIMACTHRRLNASCRESTGPARASPTRAGRLGG